MTISAKSLKNSFSNQNSQLCEVLRCVTGSGTLASTQTPVPRIGSDQTVQPAADSGRQLPAGAEASAASPDPLLRDAWLRGQLHEISQQLRTDKDKGLRKLFRQLLPSDPDDALK